MTAASTENTSAPRTRAEPANLAWRIAAIVYDLFPLVGIWFACGVLGVLLAGGQAPAPGSLGAWLQFGLLLGATWVYFLLSWRRGGQTLGMRAWRLRLLDEAGRSPDWRALNLRFALSLLSWAVLGLGFWWSLFHPERRAWHDIGSRTVLVRMPKGVG